MKIILITGGSISGIGKGLIASSIGSLLTNVTFLKIDPYLNVSAGSLGPSEHGEVFVLEDGSEVDLDLGNYQRFCDITTFDQNNSLTTGKLFKEIIQQEIEGYFLGQTIQIVPHVTEFFKEWIENISRNKDYCIIELGGTVGDIENTHFISSLRRLNNVFHIHVSLVPFIQEYKTKLIQTSTNAFVHKGLKPDFVIARSDNQLPESIIDKIQTMTMIPCMNIWNVKNIYNIPCQMEKLKQFLPISIPSQLPEFSDTIPIFIGGKYTHQDAYLSLFESLHLAARKLFMRIEFTTDKSKGGIIIPGGFGERGLDKKIELLKYARENKIPCLGICLGMQCMALEYQRNVLNFNAQSEEFSNENLVIKEMDGTMHSGAKRMNITNSETKFSKIHNKPVIYERFRHKYYVSDTSGFNVTATTEENGYPAVIELTDETHPFYMGVQYHPEFLSTFKTPNHLFVEFLKIVSGIN